MNKKGEGDLVGEKREIISLRYRSRVGDRTHDDVSKLRGEREREVQNVQGVSGL
jgi:hypothetical protein